MDWTYKTIFTEAHF